MKTHVVVFLTLSAAAAHAVSAKVRQIQEIRAVQEEVDTMRKRNELKKTSHCSPEGKEIVDIYSFAEKTIRFAYEEVGSTDSVIRVNAYYDETGRRRFVYAQSEAVNGSQFERRWYFAPLGGLIERRDK